MTPEYKALVVLLRHQSKLGPINVARGAMREAADAIESFSSSPTAQTGDAVAVKPLEWPPRCPLGQRVHNRPALVNYTIAHYGGDVGEPVYRWAEAHSPWSEPLQSYEAAKAAAQADYERRIRSALVPAPAVPDAVEAEVRRRLRWIAEARHDDNADLDAICTYADQALAALAASHMPVGDGPTIERQYVLEWTAGARPPVFPKPMRGTQSFVFFEDAVAFMARQASDSQFVSLIELVTSKIDRSDDARKTLAAARAGEDG